MWYHLMVTCVLHLNLEELQAIHTMYVFMFLDLLYVISF